MTTTTEAVTRWWHAYGGETNLAPEHAEPAIVWQLIIVGPAEKGPDLARGMDLGGQPYLASWDHAPSGAEKDQVTPEEYRDGDEDDEP